jgi:hypothetical protein
MQLLQSAIVKILATLNANNSWRQVADGATNMFLSCHSEFLRDALPVEKAYFKAKMFFHSVQVID